MIIKHGEKGHHTLVLNDGGCVQVVIAMFAMAQAWALMLLLFVCFLAF
jgi:hypothetical protein